MTKINIKNYFVMSVLILSASSMVQNNAFATPQTDLGTASNYAILSGDSPGTITNGVHNQLISRGNVGHTGAESDSFTFAAGFGDVGPGTAILGTISTPGTPIGDAHVTLTNIGTYVGGINTGLACTYTHTGAINLLTDTTHGAVGQWQPGVYCIDGAITDSTAGTLNFNASGTYVFKSNGALTTAANDFVTFNGAAGGSNANAGNLFFAPIGGASLGATNQFSGTILAGSSSIILGANINATNSRFISENTVTVGGGANLFSTPPTVTTPVSAPAPAPARAPDVSIRHPPSLGNDYNYRYADGLTINGKSFDITKYGTTIPQQVLQIGQSANFTFKIYDERGPNTISHVGMHIHFKGDTIVTNSDASIVWDKHDGIKVTDPGNLFSNTAISEKYDNNFAYISIHFTPVKAMADSSILMRMWDDKHASIDLPIWGAIIIVDPNAPVQVKEIQPNQYGDYNTLVSLLDSDGYQMPAILHKIKSGSDLSSTVDVNWIYDKGTDKLVMVETLKDGTMIGDTVFNLFKKQAEPTLTDHNYVDMPIQNNRLDPEQEKIVMYQEEIKAEKILESMYVGTRQVS